MGCEKLCLQNALNAARKIKIMLNSAMNAAIGSRSRMCVRHVDYRYSRELNSALIAAILLLLKQLRNLCMRQLLSNSRRHLNLLL